MTKPQTQVRCRFLTRVEIFVFSFASV